MLNDFGGPFGVVIVKDKEIIAVCSNMVLRDNDATVHSEINAIREASNKLNTYDLSDADAIGFRDNFIYNYINNKDDKVLFLKQIDRDICLNLFEEYKKFDKKIY